MRSSSDTSPPMAMGAGARSPRKPVYNGVGRVAGCGGSTTSDRTSDEGGSRPRRRS
uniref:Uncharacterized protein n=1 Tax=Arundo donax TaxID=35708 RepID=A0A0A9EMX2_ARUDO